MAAHLHDSVLQTLALIQREPTTRARCCALARGQERELRHWLYGHGARRERGGVARRGALDAAAAEVEDDHGVRRRRRRGRRLPARRRRSRARRTPPARRWSTRPSTPGATRSASTSRSRTTACTVFVRDRGVGFDPDAVPDDRQGIAESITGRMERHGGSVRSSQRARRGHRGPSCAIPRRPRDVSAPRVVLVDDHAAVPLAASAPSSSGARSTVVGEAGDVDEAVAAILHAASPTSCCSTCTCPAAAAPRCSPGRARAAGRAVPRAVACPTRPRT